MHEALDTTTPGGRLVCHVFAALAEFIRELIVEGTRGRPRRRPRPRYPPRPATCHDPRADPSRPRPTHPALEHRFLDRQAARRLPQHDLQVPARALLRPLYPTPTYPPRRRQPHELIATPATAPAPGPRRDFSCRWSSRAYLRVSSVRSPSRRLPEMTSPVLMLTLGW